jgi:hypothetical protein
MSCCNHASAVLVVNAYMACSTNKKTSRRLRYQCRVAITRRLSWWPMPMWPAPLVRTRAADYVTDVVWQTRVGCLDGNGYMACSTNKKTSRRLRYRCRVANTRRLSWWSMLIWHAPPFTEEQTNQNKIANRTTGAKLPPPWRLFLKSLATPFTEEQTNQDKIANRTTEAPLPPPWELLTVV